MSNICYLNGCFFREDQAIIHASDRGLLLADGLFETLRICAGHPVDLAAHWQRLQQGAKTMSIPISISPEKVCEIIYELANSNHLKEASVRITLTRGPGPRGLVPPENLNPTLLITATEYLPPCTKAFKLKRSCFTRNEHSPYIHFKTLNYTDQIAAHREAIAAGFNDALMLNTAKKVCTTSMANIFWIKEQQLLTPSIDCGVIPGITRASVLSIAQDVRLAVTEVTADYTELLHADEVFITNSLIGIMPVLCIDDTLFAGEQGEITKNLQQCFYHKPIR